MPLTASLSTSIKASAGRRSSNSEGLWIPIDHTLTRITLRLDGLPPAPLRRISCRPSQQLHPFREKHDLHCRSASPLLPHVPSLIDRPLVVGRSITHPSIHVAAGNQTTTPATAMPTPLGLSVPTAVADTISDPRNVSLALLFKKQHQNTRPIRCTSQLVFPFSTPI